LDQPLYVQYKDYLVNVAKWDFGPSFKQKGQSVNTIINRSFPYSLILGLEAIFLALSVGVFLGVFAALYHNKFGDYAAMMLDVLNSEYIKTAKAKGLSGRVTIYRHGIRNAILPVISYIGPLVISILTGSFIIERIFAIPGLGNEFVESITNRDYTVIMGTT